MNAARLAESLQRLAGLLALLGVSYGSVFAVELKVMTFNIKAATIEIGLDQHESWDYLWSNSNDRRDRVASVINAANPDIVGVQEMVYGQLNYLDNRIRQYAYYGLDRDTGSATGAGARSGIFYNHDRFDLLASGDFWLSETPDTPRTTFIGNGGDTNNARMASWIKLHDTAANQDYFVINTHWSLDGEARRLSGLLMREKIIDLAGSMPIVAMGDFNEFAGRPGYSALVRRRNASEFQLANSFAESGTPAVKTFHGYEGGIEGSPIDFVLHTSEDFRAISVDVIRTSFEGYFPSDHYPVMATYEISMPIPGDFDDDLDVDGRDFLLWQQMYGRSVSQGSGADGNHDRMVDGLDLVLWKEHFNSTRSDLEVTNLNVPEPQSLWLMAIGVSVVSCASSRNITKEPNCASRWFVCAEQLTFVCYRSFLTTNTTLNT